MAPTRVLSNEIATEMKQSIWDGLPNTGVAAAYGVSVLTVSRVRSGQAYEDIQWPDGSTGALPGHRVQRTTNARRFDTVASKHLDKDEDKPWYMVLLPKDTTIEQGRAWLEAMDEYVKRKFPGGEYRDYRHFVDKFGPKLSRAIEADKLKEHDAELQRQKEEEKSPGYAKMLAEKNRRDAELRAAHVPPSLPDDQCDPDANERYDWDEIVIISGGKNTIVEIAIAEQEASMFEAIRVVFKAFPIRQWTQPHVIQMVYQVKAKIENFWRANPDRAPKETEVAD